MAPVINDVATDLTDVPQFRHNAALNPLPAAFVPQIQKGYPELTSLVLPGVTADAAFQLCVRGAKKMPRWTFVLEDPSARVLEGYATTFLLRFKDDFTIRVQSREDAAVVDMRSKSRVGKGDLGANAARIQQFFKLVREEAAH